MLRVPIEQAEAGMTLARSVPNPEKPDHTLLKAGYEMEADKVSRLKSIGVNNLWVNYPGLDFLDDYLDPKLIEHQQELYSSLKDNFQDAQSESINDIDYRQYVDQMKNLFHYLMNAGNISSAFISELQGQSDDIFRHSTTVASLALLIGMKSEGQLLKARPNMPQSQATDLTSLGTGCLLHDMGKISLSEEMQTFHVTAMNLGSPEWQNHTEVGYEMLKAGLDPVAAQIVVNHHQHYDGSGFPKRKQLNGVGDPIFALKGHEIHIFCRIACLANYFESFRYLPDGRIAPTVVALARMKKPGYAKWFDPELYKIFTKAMPAFAMGEQVKLNDGRDVVVVEINEIEPCRPVVRPIDLKNAVSKEASAPKENEQTEDKPEQEKPESENKKSEPQEDPKSKDIDLSMNNDLYIQMVGDFDVTRFLH